MQMKNRVNTRKSHPSQQRISESNWIKIQHPTFPSTVNTYKVVLSCTNVHILWCLMTYIQHSNGSTTLGQRPYRRPIKKLILLQTNTFQDITNQTLFLPVSINTTVKKSFLCVCKFCDFPCRSPGHFRPIYLSRAWLQVTSTG